MNTSYSINSLTKEDIANILESLLFASSVDVCASWYKENALNFLELAKKIRKYFPDVILENIYVFENEKNDLNDEHSKEILNFFPELKKEFQIKE